MLQQKAPTAVRKNMTTVLPQYFFATRGDRRGDGLWSKWLLHALKHHSTSTQSTTTTRICRYSMLSTKSLRFPCPPPSRRVPPPQAVVETRTTAEEALLIVLENRTWSEYHLILENFALLQSFLYAWPWPPQYDPPRPTTSIVFSSTSRTPQVAPIFLLSLLFFFLVV